MPHDASPSSAATHPAPQRTLVAPDHVLLAAVTQAFNAVLITDAMLDGPGPSIVYCNPAFCRMTGYSAEELLGRSPAVLQGPLTDPQVMARMRACLHRGEFFEGAAINYRKDGSCYHVEWNVSPVRDAQGAVSHFVSVQQDITAREQARRERELLASALSATHAPALITDQRGRVVFANPAFEDMSGFRADELLGNTPRLLQSGQHSRDFYRQLHDTLALGRSVRVTFANRHKHGHIYHAEESIAPLRDSEGRISHFVSIAKDVTERVQREQALRDQAQRDALTGLHNRHAGQAALQRCDDLAQTAGQPYALVLADIDHFKQINDRFGHPAGDRALCAVAALLGARVRSSDWVVRWGGEEFLLILPGCGLQRAHLLAQDIRQAVARQHDAQIGAITVSLGVAAWQPPESSSALLRRADQALYAAKRGGRNQVALAPNLQAA